MSIIELEIQAQAKDIGDNFIVRRSLPRAERKMVGPFIFWDHMGPVSLNGQQEMKVRAHPHIGLATITYLFNGRILHRDSLGNEEYIIPGEVNWMTAGEGIVHSERARAQEGEELLLEGIQLWVALPQKFEKVKPSFVHFKEKDLPLIEKESIEFRLIAGEFNGFKSPVPVYSSLFYTNAKASSDSTFKYQLKTNEEAALYMVQGEASIEGKKFTRFDMVVFKKGSSISIEFSSNSEFMFFGGEVFSEKRYIWWNFVSSQKELIEEAKIRWSNDEFGHVINEEERIPLPEI